MIENKKKAKRKTCDSIEFGKCDKCRGDLIQWNEKESDGSRSFYERCPECKETWQTGIVTAEEKESLHHDVYSEDFGIEKESLPKRIMAKKLKIVNDMLMRRGKRKKKKHRK